MENLQIDYEINQSPTILPCKLRKCNCGIILSADTYKDYEWGEMMVGWIKCTAGKGRESAAAEQICGIDMLIVTFPTKEIMRPTALVRQLNRVEKLFQRAGVNRVIFSADFPYRDKLRQVKEVDSNEFYRAVADVLVVGWMEFYGIAKKDRRVALAGPRVCPEMERAAQNLCRRIRKVCIEVPGEEGAALAAKLQKTCGIPVMPRGVPVDLTVEFGPAQSNGQMRLWGDQPSLDGFELLADGVELPDEVSQPMMALLWERGRLRREQLHFVKKKEKYEKRC